MPFTPFHFGPGLLLKSGAPRRISFVAYAAANVAVDLEPLLNILRDHLPHHGHVHTLAVASPLGLAVGTATGVVLGRLFPRAARADAAVRGEISWLPAAIGGLLGGATHPLIDGLMHLDAEPFWPWYAGNPLLGLMPLPAVYGGCAVLGLLGAWILMRRARLSPRRAPPA